MLGSSASSSAPMMTKPLRLRRVNHADEIVSGFSKLLKTESMTDVTLICNGGQTIRAHRVILSTFSPYFKAIFEAQPFSNNPCQYPVIVIKDLALSELRAIVEFIYKGEVSVSRDKLSAILHAARALEVSGLSDLKIESSSLQSSGVAAVMAANGFGSSSHNNHGDGDKSSSSSSGSSYQHSALPVSASPSSSSTHSILASLTSGHPMGSLNLSANGSSSSAWKRSSTESLISSSLFSHGIDSHPMKKSRIMVDGNSSSNGCKSNYTDRMNLSSNGDYSHHGLNLSSAESIRNALSSPARFSSNLSGYSTSREMLHATLNQQLKSRNMTVEQFLAQKHQQRQLKSQKLRSQQIQAQMKQQILQQQLLRNPSSQQQQSQPLSLVPGSSSSSISSHGSKGSPSRSCDSPSVSDVSKRVSSPKESISESELKVKIEGTPEAIKVDDKPEDMRTNINTDKCDREDAHNSERHEDDNGETKVSCINRNGLDESRIEGTDDHQSDDCDEDKPLQLTIETTAESGDDEETDHQDRDTNCKDLNGEENNDDGDTERGDEEIDEDIDDEDNNDTNEGGKRLNGNNSKRLDQNGNQTDEEIDNEDNNKREEDMDEEPIVINTSVEDMDGYISDEINGDNDDYEVDIAKDLIFQRQQQLRLQQLQRQHLYQLSQQSFHHDSQETKLLEFYEQLQVMAPFNKQNCGDHHSDDQEGFMDDYRLSDQNKNSRNHQVNSVASLAAQNRSLAMLVSNHNNMSLAAAMVHHPGLMGNGTNPLSLSSSSSASSSSSSPLNSRNNNTTLNNNSNNSNSGNHSNGGSSTPLATPDFLQPRGPGRPRKGNKAQDISPCPECHKVFVRPDVLKLHYRSVHLNERHPCNMCPKIFKWPGDLSKHKRTKHPEALAAQAAAAAAAAAATANQC